MFCTNCGTQLQDQAKFCYNCGQVMQPTQSQNPPGGHAAPHQLPGGTTLRGRYRVDKVLGQGGFGITYLGFDNLMETQVAIKEFYPGGTVYRDCTQTMLVRCVSQQQEGQFQASKARFLREAKALVKFKHIPEVVDILDFIEENNTAYIIMEYVQGMSLANYVAARGGRLTAEETFSILSPVMQALAAVHKGGIVHRDIAPDNIMLHPMGGAKLLDFGAVRALENIDADTPLAKSTEAILKHGFAPIEQYNSRGSLGPWTDEYAMCATVYYCLTGKVPAEASMRISEGAELGWNTIPGLLPQQAAALEKGMALRAKDRFPDMDQLLFALFSRKTEPVASGPVSGTTPGPGVSGIQDTSRSTNQSASVAKKTEKSTSVWGVLFLVVFFGAIFGIAMLLLVFGGGNKSQSVKDPGGTIAVVTQEPEKITSATEATEAEVRITLNQAYGVASEGYFLVEEKLDDDVVSWVKDTSSGEREAMWDRIRGFEVVEKFSGFSDPSWQTIVEDPDISLWFYNDAEEWYLTFLINADGKMMVYEKEDGRQTYRAFTGCQTIYEAVKGWMPRSDSLPLASFAPEYSHYFELAVQEVNGSGEPVSKSYYYQYDWQKNQIMNTLNGLEALYGIQDEEPETGHRIVLWAVENNSQDPRYNYLRVYETGYAYARIGERHYQFYNAGDIYWALKALVPSY